jgi:hypothetical protein
MLGAISNAESLTCKDGDPAVGIAGAWLDRILYRIPISFQQAQSVQCIGMRQPIPLADVYRSLRCQRSNDPDLVSFESLLDRPEDSIIFAGREEEKRARSGNLWVTGGSQRWGLREEAVELAAGGVEGALLVFPAVVNQRAAVLVDYIADELFRSNLPQMRVFVHVANDLSAKQPHIVDVVLDGSFRQAALDEMKEEGHEV